MPARWWRMQSRRARLIRLRPTARGSTLRDTARPRRGSPSPGSQCRPSRASPRRRPPSNTRVYSTRERTRALRGNRARGSVVISLDIAVARVSVMTGPRGESGAQALAALGAATRQDLAAVSRLHAGTEAVVALALEVAGLVGALGGHGGTRFVNGAKEPESLVRPGPEVKPE